MSPVAGADGVIRPGVRPQPRESGPPPSPGNGRARHASNARWPGLGFWQIKGRVTVPGSSRTVYAGRMTDTPKDPWTDPDPKPGDFDPYLAGIDPSCIEVHAGNPDVKLTVIADDDPRA